MRLPIRSVLLLSLAGFALCVAIGRTADPPVSCRSPVADRRSEPPPESRAARYYLDLARQERSELPLMDSEAAQWERCAWAIGEPAGLTPGELFHRLRIEPRPDLPLAEALRATRDAIMTDRAAWFASDEPID